MTTLCEWRQQAERRLSACSDSPQADVSFFLQHVLKKNTAWLRLHDNEPLASADAQLLDNLLIRREAGEPVAYILGEKGFWSLDLQVNRATLIPRPDTELLVEIALETLPDHQALAVLDLGTGSGAIALAVAKERTQATVTAIDQSAAALAVAQENATRNALVLRFLQGNWFAPVAGESFDMILSNPPYIAENDPHLSRGDVRFEPLTALVSGADGLNDLRHIVATAPAYLKPEGWLAVEHGFDQGMAVRELFAQAGFAFVETRPDMEGRERVTLGQFRGPANAE